LLVKDLGSSSSKTQRAKELGIKIMTKDQMIKRYKL